MEFQVKEENGIIVIALAGKIMGGPEAGQINDRINNLIEQGKTRIVIDLEQVELMNSSGLGILIGAVTTLKNSDGKLCLIHASDRIQNLLRITKLERVFLIKPDLNAALKVL